MKINIKDPKFIVIIVACIIILGFAIKPYSAFAGGWEIQDSINSLTINNKGKLFNGYHEASLDPDDDMGGAPDIIMKVGNPYYVRKLADGSFVKSDNPFILDTYTKEIGNTTYRFTHYVYAFDVSFQTDADKFYQGGWAYGWNYESAEADIKALVNFKINPWQPSGIKDDWKIVSGKAGIMSSSILDLSYGLIEKDATENVGHVITNLMSRGQALNMFTSFDKSDTILKGVPDNVNIELVATLAAGASYTADLIGHWNSLSVRNVFVLYTIRIDIVTVLGYQLIAGHQSNLEAPQEDNTNYAPRIPLFEGINNFFGGIFSFLTSPLTMIFAVITIIVVFVLVIKVARWWVI